jgi:hypothetical protein
MGSNSQTTNQSQSSQFAPWAPAIPGLQNIIQQLSGGGAPLTGQQSGALNQLQAAGLSVPNFGAQGSNAVNGLFNTTTQPQIGLWNNAQQQQQNTLSNYLLPGYTNPMTAPGLAQALATNQEDITNSINGQFAAAGRSDSPDNTKALARGLAQGEAPIITNEFNTLSGNQLGAANSLLSGAGSTASGTAELGQIPLQNTLQGIGAGQQLPSLYGAPGLANLQYANIGQQLPFENLQLPASLLGALGGMGGTSSGTGTSTTTQPVNPFTTALGAGLGLFALSDRRLKEDVEPIGLLFNGLPFYKYRFRGSPKTEVGVMAQDVERVNPSAVVDIGLWRGGPSVKMVDYDRATRPSEDFSKTSAMAA